MPIVDAVLARVSVEDVERALSLYAALSGTDEIRRLRFRDVELAWVGNFLLLSLGHRIRWLDTSAWRH